MRNEKIEKRRSDEIREGDEMRILISAAVWATSEQSFGTLL
jgi:hypothetical protein